MSDQGASGKEATTTQRILVSIHHPAQAHFYRHIVTELTRRGHEVRVCVRDKEMTAQLLGAFDIPHSVLAESSETLPGTIGTQLAYEYRLLREARAFQPDVLTAIGGIEIAHVAPFVGARTLAFDDTAARTGRLLTIPSLDVVCTPAGFDRPVRGHERPYDGYHELAYLHPDRFEPAPERLRAHGVDTDETYFVLRFAAWNAHHDVGEHGLSEPAKRRLVDALSERGEVYISSESTLPADLEAHRLPVPVHCVHDLLAFADLYVGDSGTMATEAAVLGTPAVRSNSLAGDDDLSNFVELEENYGLLASTTREEAMFEHIETFLAESEETIEKRRRRLIDEKEDVTAYAVGQLEALAGAVDTARHATATTPGEQPAHMSEPNPYTTEQNDERPWQTSADTEPERATAVTQEETVTLPEGVNDRIETRIEDTHFESTDEYVTLVMELVVDKLDRESESGDEDNRERVSETDGMEEQLESLGYL